MTFTKMTPLTLTLFSLLSFCQAMNPEFLKEIFDENTGDMISIVSDPELVVTYGSHGEKGKYRDYMEDAHFPYNKNDSPLIADKTLFFGVYDGHGGSTAANFSSYRLHENIIKSENFPNNIGACLTAGYTKTDAQYSHFYTGKAGTTAVTALFHEKQLWIANVGDSEAIGCFDGSTAQCLTQRYTPEDPAELDRICNIFGHQIRIFQQNKILVFCDNQMHVFDQTIKNIRQQTNKLLKTYKLDGSEEYINQFNSISHITINKKNKQGSLAVSRAIGDQDFKPFCIAEPFVQSFEITQPGFVILACDGLWDVMSYQATVNFVLHQLMLKNLTLETVTPQAAQEISQALVEKAIEIWDHDNVTATIVFFNPCS